MKSILRLALACLRLDEGRSQATHQCLFSACFATHLVLSAPLGGPHDLYKCWGEPSALSHQTSDGRTFAAMQDGEKWRLSHIPAIEPSVASLVLSLEEAFRLNARCPPGQYKLMDDLVSPVKTILPTWVSLGILFPVFKFSDLCSGP